MDLAILLEVPQQISHFHIPRFHVEKSSKIKMGSLSVPDVGGAGATRKTFDIDLSLGEFRREEDSFDVTLVADSADGSTGRQNHIFPYNLGVKSIDIILL